MYSGHQYSFLCPHGTVFNQAVRVCDWWSNVNCPASEQLYANNDELYRQPNSTGIWYQGKQQKAAHHQTSAKPNGKTILKQLPLRILKDGNSFPLNTNQQTHPTSALTANLAAKTVGSDYARNVFRGNIKYSHKDKGQYQDQMKQNQYNLKIASTAGISSPAMPVNRSRNRNRNFSSNSNSNRTYNSMQTQEGQEQEQEQEQQKHLTQLKSSLKANSRKTSNPNKLNNNDELKDYKSKIKNKYNIDYDHALDAEYEIIEAIEWNDLV